MDEHATPAEEGTNGPLDPGETLEQKIALAVKEQMRGVFWSLFWRILLAIALVQILISSMPARLS